MSGRKVPSFRKVITKTGVYTMGLLCLTQPLLNVSAHAYAMTDDAQSHSNAYISESGLYNEATLLNKATRNKENQSLQNNNVNHQYTATPSSTKESYNRIGKSNSVPVTNVQAPTINKKDSEQLKSETQKEDEHASSSNNASLEEAQSEDSQQNGNNGANEDPAPIKPENHTQPSDQGQASPQGGETPPKDETGDSSQDGNSPSKPDHESPDKDDKPSDSDQQPPKHDDKPSDSDQQPPKHDDKPSDSDQQPPRHDDKPPASDQQSDQGQKPKPKPDTPKPEDSNTQGGNGGASTSHPNYPSHQNGPAQPNTNGQFPYPNIPHYQPNGTTDHFIPKNQASNNQSNNDFYQRYSKLIGTGYKYNPLFTEQIENLKQNGNLADFSVQQLNQKQQFLNNSYLNQLQKNSDYFRFQYFNPLSTQKYYNNLDKQVLALITGKVGSMPDLKKPSDKTVENDHQQDKVEKIEQHGENLTEKNMNNEDTDTKHTFSLKLISLVGALSVGCVSIISYILWRRRHHI
ncbi:SdrH family protein [Staphylococcus coagulans]|uniref:SdrH family protein n=1 Tax=Staphylococcus coagulans TaxID=74706 RepID=UPI0030ED50C0